MLTSALIGIAGAAYGGISSARTNKANKQAAAQAKADEKERRERALAEMSKAQEAYNALREERPGVTFEQWKREYVGAISDPVLREEFSKAKEDDFLSAVDFASRASQTNLESFADLRNALSQGAAPELTSRLNELALQADTPAAMQRAMEIRGGYIPSGTVQYDAQGRLVEGQRADKQVFTAAYEADLAARDRQFRMSRDLLGDYTSVAERQQEKARDFLQFASLEPTARALTSSAMETAIGFQRQDEQNQFDLIKQYAAAASGVQPVQPTYQPTAQSDALMGAGISTAIKGLASYFGEKKNTPTYVGPQQYYLKDGTEVRRALPV